MAVAFIASSTVTFSQWSTDPANPLLVCDVANWQRDSQAVPDGSGGAFVFWRDSRNSEYIFEVYGQRYDQNGIALWEENGRLIVADADGKNVVFFSLYRYDDGKMIICWYAGEEGVANPDEKMWVQELDDEGAKVWENDLALSEEHSSGPLSVGYYYTCQLVRDDFGFHAMMEIGTYGYLRMRMSRFSEAGELLMQYHGVEIGPLSFGHASITTDGANGAFVYYSSGNGGGATLHCMHIDEYAGELWGDWVNVTANTTGLSYQFSGIGDGMGVTFVWQGGGVNAEELFARRLNTDGSWAWAGSTTEICTFDGVQKNFYWEKQGDNYYITWADGRPGMVGYYAIYGQKFDITGQTLWQEDGIQIADLNTYLPYPKFALDSDLNMYACHQSTLAGYVAQKVADNGTLQWDADGQQLTITDFNPFYEKHQEFLSGTNLLAAWVKPWSGGGTDGVYITRIAEPSNTVYINETVTACDNYEVNGINYTESGVFDIILPGDTLLTLDLTIVDLDESVSLIGTTLTSLQSNATYQWFDCYTNQPIDGANAVSFTPAESGEYATTIAQGACNTVSECTMVIIIGVEEMLNENSFTVFPNPFEESLTIQNNSQEKISCVEVVDVFGRIVYSESISRTPSVLQLDQLAAGTYLCRLKAVDKMFSEIVVKR